MEKSYPKTRWHRLLGSVLMEWLTPVGIDVKVDVSVSAEPPEIDIVLLQNTADTINREQKERLADGLRDSDAQTLILEFKYTESLNEDAVLQALAYETFYRRIRNIPKDKVSAFLLSSKTPRNTTLASLGYASTKHSGVYRSSYPGIGRVTLLLLNELSDEPHNIPLKCFASKKNEMRKAHEYVHRNRLPGMSLELEWILDGLWRLLLNKHVHNIKEPLMKEVEELTPEYVKQVGKEWINHLKAVLPPEELLSGLDAKTRLKGLKPEERLQGLAPEERLRGLAPEERLQGLAPEERLLSLSLLFDALSPEELKILKEKLKGL